MPPAVLTDEQACLPHQRPGARTLIAVAAGFRSIALNALFDKAFATNINNRFVRIGDLREAIIKARDTSPSGEGDDLDKMKKEIQELAIGERNRAIAHNKSITQQAVNEVTSQAAEIVNRNAHNLYATVNDGSSQSNTTSTIQFGYFHAGDQQQRFVPNVAASVVGAELVVTIQEQEVLRTDALNPNFDEQFA